RACSKPASTALPRGGAGGVAQLAASADEAPHLWITRADHSAELPEDDMTDYGQHGHSEWLTHGGMSLARNLDHAVGGYRPPFQATYQAPRNAEQHINAPVFDILRRLVLQSAHAKADSGRNLRKEGHVRRQQDD